MNSNSLGLYGGNPVRAKERFIIFGKPQIEENEIKEVEDCMRSGWIGTGPKVHQFEEEFAKFKNIKYAVAVNSCTAALHLSLVSLGIGTGDEVITTPMTFCATINAIIHTGATPVIADCEKDTMNISPEEIEKKITSKTKAILPVHFAGRICNMNEIMRIAKKHNLFVVEDCAHAIESEYNGQKSGTFGDIGCFSFYVTKNVITGEGGMIITNKESIVNKLKIFALHGMSKDAWKRFSDDGYKHYEVMGAGYKYNMMDIQAAIGIHQLRRVEKNSQKRQHIWERYQEKFKELHLFLPSQTIDNEKHAYHLYTPLVNKDKSKYNRDWVLTALTSENIGVGVHYLPIHFHKFYRENYGWRIGDYPNAEFIGDRTFSLPLSPALNDNDIEDIIEAVRKVLSYNVQDSHLNIRCI